MKRYDFKCKQTRLVMRGKLLVKQSREVDKHVYTDSKEEAIKQLEMKGYKVVEDE